MRAGGSLAGLALGAALACAPHPSGEPRPLRSYRLLIEGKDSLSDELARELGTRGFAVERHVVGGGPRVAALIWFTFRDPEDGRFFGLRVADTRTGAVVAAVSLPLDSLGAPPSAARRLGDSLAAHLAAP